MDGVEDIAAGMPLWKFEMQYILCQIVFQVISRQKQITHKQKRNMQKGALDICKILLQVSPTASSCTLMGSQGALCRLLTQFANI